MLKYNIDYDWHGSFSESKLADSTPEVSKSVAPSSSHFDKILSKNLLHVINDNITSYF